MRRLLANAGMRYREHPVPAELRSHVACAWHLVDAAPAGSVQTIYPDGCCELIVHLGAPPRSRDAVRGWHEQAATMFAAQHLGPVRLSATQPLDCVGLRLQPEASMLIAGRVLPRDRILDLEQVDAPLARALRRAAPAFAAGDADALWEVMRRRCADSVVDVTVAAAVAQLRDSGGMARIALVARSLSLSVRTLQARFRRHVGLTPKEYARVMRLRATLRALDSGDDSLADVAADRGFADQAHAAREMRRITGLAPSRLRAALRKDRDGDVAVRLAAAFVRGQA